ncbi:HTH domain-containing protein [Listeria booriae]|uniref:helix-turn-helix domain-containing protein n=1 Tax=Listeria booriae TaxID=1552123 RepID=UPI0016291B09|nr:helix-turn-helix domain-containing protein [Listeria booriae]MBC2098238.1 HTH domain-containing protein [Listeria booriae]
MDRLHLDLVIEKKNRRHIEIVSYIYNSKYPLTADELSDYLRVSVKTIQRDILEIQNLLPTNVYIITMSNTSYELKLPHDVTLKDVIEIFTESSLLFTIIDSIYHGIQLDIHDWALELFSSQSSLYRHLNTLKKLLVAFNLKLSLTPVDIVGKEEDIRYFYFNYFYNAKNSPKMEVPSKQIYTFHEKSLQRFEKYEHANIDIQYHRFLYWIMVINQRVSLGHTIQMPDDIKAYQQTKPVYHYFDKYMHFWAEEFDLPVNTPDETAYFSIIFYDTLIYKKEDLREVVYGDEYTQQKDVLHFLQESFTALNLPMPTNDDLLIYENYFYYVYSMSRLTPLLHTNTYEVNRYIKKEHPSIFATWVKTASDSPFLKKIKGIYTEDIAVNLTMLTRSIFYDNNMEKKHILFSFDGRNAFLNYLSTLAKNYSANNMKISFIPNRHITKEILRESKVDILVLNYESPFDLEKCPHICVYQTNHIPSKQDWGVVKELIFQASLKFNA